jgi:hypothetical protein
MDHTGHLTAYEQERLLRIAENKRQIQAIGLDVAVLELKQTENKPKGQARSRKAQIPRDSEPGEKAFAAAICRAWLRLTQL